MAKKDKAVKALKKVKSPKPGKPMGEKELAARNHRAFSYFTQTKDGKAAGKRNKPAPFKDWEKAFKRFTEVHDVFMGNLDTIAKERLEAAGLPVPTFSAFIFNGVGVTLKTLVVLAKSEEDAVDMVAEYQGAVGEAKERPGVALALAPVTSGPAMWVLKPPGGPAEPVVALPIAKRQAEPAPKASEEDAANADRSTAGK